MNTIDIDVKSLHKGMIIDTKTLETAFKVSKKHADYSFKCMRLVNLIEAYRPDYWTKTHETNPNTNLYPMMCRTSSSGIHVMTDEEALTYKANQHELGIKKLYRTKNQLKKIDTSSFNAEQIAAYDKETRKQADIVRSIRQERRKHAVSLIPTPRAKKKPPVIPATPNQTPVLPLAAAPPKTP